MNQLHDVQNQIILKLQHEKRARFSELNETGLTNDHFTFHIKQLLKSGLIEKDEKYYRLTVEGKAFASLIDSETKQVEKQAKLGVLIVCIREKEGQKECLLQQRLKEPYHGFWGFPTGKILYGETVEETADRELMEEANLSANLKLVAIKHKMDFSKEGRFLEDKYFFLFRAEDTSGDLRKDFEGGKNAWMTEDEIYKQKNIFNDVEESLELIKSDKLKFTEIKYQVEGF